MVLMAKADLTVMLTAAVGGMLCAAQARRGVQLWSSWNSCATTCWSSGAACLECHVNGACGTSDCQQV
jgi:hypothetical protein